MAVAPAFPEFEPYVKRLLGYYDAADARLRELLRDATLNNTNRRRLQAILRQIENETQRLLTDGAAWDREAIEFAYGRGRAQANRALGIQSMEDTFAGLPTGSLEALARDAAGQRQAFVGNLLRQSDDYLRRAAEGALGRGLALGESAPSIGRAIREGLIARIDVRNLARGIDATAGVVYSNGTVHSLHAYGQMSARAGLARVAQVAQTDRFAETGVHVVKVPNNGTLCHLCKPYEGKCFALDSIGEAMGYPSIREWYKHGLHPNCRHIALIPVLSPGDTDAPPDAEFLGVSNKELYKKHIERFPQLHQARRQGFASTQEWQRYKRMGKAEGIPLRELRGPRFRYQDIERRRIAATVDMLNNPGLSYADAMSRQTRKFMQGAGYRQQRPFVTPAEQARLVKDY